MLTLYYAPGACSMASHITLEEAGVPYETKMLAMAKQEQRSETYLKLNPRGKVPALDVDGTILTENLAILTYLALTNPAKKLLPDDPFQRAKCLSHMAYLGNTVHPAFTHFVRPERFTEDPNAAPATKAMGKKTSWGLLGEIDGLLAGKDWVMGSQFTVADPYTLVFYGWGVRAELPVGELKNYTAFKDRMVQRPAVRKVLEREQSPLLKAA
jgi:glutathione S-transferase